MDIKSREIRQQGILLCRNLSAIVRFWFGGKWEVTGRFDFEMYRDLISSLKYRSGSCDDNTKWRREDWS